MPLFRFLKLAFMYFESFTLRPSPYPTSLSATFPSLPCLCLTNYIFFNITTCIVNSIINFSFWSTNHHKVFLWIKKNLSSLFFFLVYSSYCVYLLLFLFYFILLRTLNMKYTGDIKLPAFKIHYKAAVTKTIWYLHKNRHRDHCHKTEHPETKRVYCQLTIQAVNTKLWQKCTARGISIHCW